MKNKVLEAYSKLARDYEKNVDTESGGNAYYEHPAMMEATKRRVGEKANVFAQDLGEPLPFKDETFHYIISSLYTILMIGNLLSENSIV